MTKQINQDVAGFKDDFFKGLSIRECLYGGTALDVAAERIGGDFFLLPSSVHECILVPKNGFDEKELQNMVMTVNQSQVSPEDRLSDNVYSYDANEHKLSLATDNKEHEQSLDHTMEQKESQKHSAKTH